MKNPVFLPAGIACAFLALSTPAIAATTDWVDVVGGEVRMISSDAPLAAGEYRLGIEFKMEPGWHIYWRFPGESGVPTEADFSTSANLGSARLQFPAPERYNDGYSTAIIYRDNVILPVSVTAKDPAAPLEIAANLRFGICSDICVPAEALLKLPLSADMPRDEAVSRMLATAWDALPRQQDATLPRIAAIDRQPAGAKGKSDFFRITVELSDSTAPFDLFAEGAAGSYIEVPRLISSDGAKATFELSADGLQTNGGRTPLILVLVNGKDAVELAADVASSASN